MIRTASLALVLLTAASALAFTAPVPAQETTTESRDVVTKPGLHERTLQVGEKEREFLVKIPRGYVKDLEDPVPVVLMLHGRGSDGEQAASRYYGWSALADAEEFIAVFPTALGRPRSWQAAFRGRATDDTTFLSQLVETLVEDYAIDPARVFMTGHSSGGFMSYSFAALHPEKVAAIAPVAGLFLGAKGPKVPVSVISFHGQADNIVAYDDEFGQKATYRGMRSALDSCALFARSLARDDEVPERQRTELADGEVLLDTWADGPRGTRIEFYSLKGWGHGWPGERAKVEATPLIWAFFEEHAREPAADEEEDGEEDEAGDDAEDGKSK